MTILGASSRQCAVCNAITEFTTMASSNACGSDDLDSRPPEMYRSTISTWIQRCPQCGYCSPDIGELIPGSESVVKTDEYRKQLADEEYPEIANSFLCWAAPCRQKEDYSTAAWAMIYAAWICDDENKRTQASSCRSRAAEALLLAEKHGQVLNLQNGANTAILADLLRRSGQFHAAQKAIEERRGEIRDDSIRRILDFQMRLIGEGDASCHTMSEALGAEN